MNSKSCGLAAGNLFVCKRSWVQFLAPLVRMTQVESAWKAVFFVSLSEHLLPVKSRHK